MYALARHEEGITINELEFVLNEDDTVMEFETVEDAKKFAIGKGLPEDAFGYAVFAYDLNTNTII